MAQFTDLFAYSDGDIVSVSGGNWVKQSATGWSYPVASSVFSLDDGSCSWGDVQQVLANTLAGNITGDFEILAQVQITAPATFAVGVCVGPAIIKTAAAEFYSCKYNGTDGWGIAYFQGGSEWSNIQSATGIYTPIAATDFWIRIGRVGTTVHAKVWQTAEPGSWQLTGTDSSVTTARPGIVGRDCSASPYRYKYFSIGTDTDPAPAPAGSAPTAPGTVSHNTVKPTTANIAWTAGGAGTTQYRYRLNGGSWVVLGNVLSINATGLTPLTLYNVDVQAGNVTNDWSASTSDSFTTTAPTTGSSVVIGNGQHVTVSNRLLRMG